MSERAIEIVEVTRRFGPKVAVDGVSLTVNLRPGPTRARVALVPFTLQHTTLAELQAGDAVHLEADVIGRYVQALLSARS